MRIILPFFWKYLNYRLILSYFVYVCNLPACMYVHCMCLISTEIKRQYHMPKNWKYQWF